MIFQIALVLVLQLIFFTFYYRSGFFVAKVIGRRVCPVCFAAGSTWLTLILLKTFGILDVNRYLIAILLSESVVGVSYLIEEFKMAHPVNIPDYILKFGIIIYGTFSILTFAFISEIVGFALFLPIILFGFYALTPTRRS
jgi:hypothetical protein